MTAENEIRKLDPEEHSDWCSSMACAVKKDGSLRICINPQKQNKSLKHNPHKVPKLKEINPRLAGANVFSKLDAKSGYGTGQSHSNAVNSGRHSGHLSEDIVGFTCHSAKIYHKTSSRQAWMMCLKAWSKYPMALLCLAEVRRNMAKIWPTS